MYIRKITNIDTENMNFVYVNDDLFYFEERSNRMQFLSMLGQVARGETKLAKDLVIENFYDNTGIIEENQYPSLKAIGNYKRILTRI